jgi:predicted RecB family nuclease
MRKYVIYILAVLLLSTVCFVGGYYFRSQAHGFIEVVNAKIATNNITNTRYKTIMQYETNTVYVISNYDALLRDYKEYVSCIPHDIITSNNDIYFSLHNTDITNRYTLTVASQSTKSLKVYIGVSYSTSSLVGANALVTWHKLYGNVNLYYNSINVGVGYKVLEF